MSSVTELGAMAVNKLRNKLFKAAYDPNKKEGFEEKGVLDTIKGTFSNLKDRVTGIYVKDATTENESANIKNKTADANGLTPPKLPTPPPDAASSFAASFAATFISFVGFVALFFICTTAGSMAANDAIGRSVAIRLVYFLYASIPLFSPFVLIYYAFRFFYFKTYPVWYNYLPLTTFVSETPFINILLKPFVYESDANVEYQHEMFKKTGDPFVWDFTPPAKPTCKYNKPNNTDTTNPNSSNEENVIENRPEPNPPNNQGANKPAPPNNEGNNKPPPSAPSTVPSMPPAPSTPPSTPPALSTAPSTAPSMPPTAPSTAPSTPPSTPTPIKKAVVIPNNENVALNPPTTPTKQEDATKNRADFEPQQSRA